jgi:hypothetical protein
MYLLILSRTHTFGSDLVYISWSVMHTKPHKRVPPAGLRASFHSQFFNNGDITHINCRALSAVSDHSVGCHGSHNSNIAQQIASSDWSDREKENDTWKMESPFARMWALPRNAKRAVSAPHLRIRDTYIYRTGKLSKLYQLVQLFSTYT